AGVTAVAFIRRAVSAIVTTGRCRSKEQTMATPRKNEKKTRAKRRIAIDDVADEELQLAEEILRKGREEQADLVAGWEKFMKQLGIQAKPIGAKKLREMALREGINPESNEFSQGIIAMREE